MTQTITITSTRAEPQVLRLVLRMPLDVPEMMERLQRILADNAGWLDDHMSQGIRSWADRTIALLPGDQGAAIDYLKVRVEELRQKILFDPLDCGPLVDAQIAGPGLVSSRQTLDHWRSASALAGESFPLVDGGMRVHHLACSIIAWARDICPPDKPKGSIRSVTDPSLARIKHLIYLTRAKDAEAVHYGRLTQRDAEERTAQLQQQTAGLREMARTIEADRARSAEEHRHHIEENLQQLQTVLTTSEQSMQRELNDRRAHATNLTAQLAASQVINSVYEQQIIRLQNELQSLRR